MSTDTLHLRPATVGDGPMLLGMRNDPTTVRFSKTGRPVSIHEHDLWLAERLARPQPELWIAEVDDQPVGQVRVDINDGIAEVSIAVSEEQRGRGFAAGMLALLKARLAGNAKILELVATIHRDNDASRKSFERAGFQEKDRAGDFLHFRCENR